MKTFNALAFAFLLGVLTGAALLSFARPAPVQKSSSPLQAAGPGAKSPELLFAKSIEYQVDAALRLGTGELEGFTRELEMSLPDEVISLNALGSSLEKQRAMERVRDYYQATGKVIPNRIAEILSSLPHPAGAAGGSQSEEFVDKTAKLKLGDAFPRTALPTIDGQTLDLTGKVTVLNFFATWCGPCLQEMPHLESDLWTPKKHQGLVVVAVGRGHSAEELQAFFKRSVYTFPVVADPQQELYGEVAGKYIPRSVVLGKDGLVKYQSVGFSRAGFAELIKAVDAELEK